MIYPVVAHRNYFRSGNFLSDITKGYIPVLIDPSLPEEKIKLESDSLRNLKLNLHRQSHSFLKKKSSLAESDQKWITKFPDEFAIGFRTSGSSGEPKVFFKTQNEIFSEILELRKLFQFESLSEESYFLVDVPLCHLYGFLWGFVLPFSLEVSAIDSYEFGETIRLLKAKQKWIWITIPSKIRSLVDLLSYEKPISLNGSLVVSSGSILQESLAAEFEKIFSVPILEIYGSTETGGIGYRYPAKESGFLPFRGVEIQIQNEETKIQSFFIMPELLDRDGYFTLRDRLDFEQNRIVYRGRTDRIVKRNSKRIHLDELEREMEKILGVDSCMALEYQPETIGVLIEESKVQALEVDLHKILERKLPRHYIPDQILLCPRLPLTHNGKKDYPNAKRFFLTDKDQKMPS